MKAPEKDECATRSVLAVRTDFLRIPPFPGARIEPFVQARSPTTSGDALIDAIRQLRVGGTYWGAQPKLPEGCLLVRSAAAFRLCGEPGRKDVVVWGEQVEGPALTMARAVVEDCDPWHMLSSAAAVFVDDNDEIRVIAAVLGVRTYVHHRATGTVSVEDSTAERLLDQALQGFSFRNPFTLEVMSPSDAIELCGFWRQMIDRNRKVGGGLGFAFWKQDHVAPLLWSGSGSFPFLRSARDAASRAAIAVWRGRTSARDLALLEKRKIPLIEVEDGFLRSHGLGADCVPPLSITVDHLGAHYNPEKPSELECLLQEGTFDALLLERAGRLRQAIVEAGIGKYERSDGLPLARPAGARLHILVPGQVEDDLAVQCGGSGLKSNLELLMRVRAEEPDAFVLYKPHPDVLAGHRRGAIADRTCLNYADKIIEGAAISSLIDMVDEVHVNTSLAGFEALLRGKRVTTHGVPFYAGWGLTRDLGPVPARRTARRTLDEIVAAALLIYPRYLDPVTGLPCPAEVVVNRLTSAAAPQSGVLVRMRRFQGKLMRRFRGVVP